tara:strand:+ start:390 stop:2270 length:1881 start_codon:yes stop_codon:yes gene_type:complete
LKIKNSLIILDKFTKFDDWTTLSSSNSKIIAIDFETHEKLEQFNVSHELLDDYLDKSERQELYDYVLTKYKWYENISNQSDFESNHINILSLMSSLEFHEFLLIILIKFFSIKNLLAKNTLHEVYVSKNNSQFIKLLQNDIKIHTIQSITDEKKGFLTDKIEIRFNIMSKPITFYLSKKTFSFLKSKYENLVCNLNNLWLNEKSTKDIILLVEFNSNLYSELIKTLSNSKKQLVLLNRRRPSILGKNSIELMKSNDIKILNPENFFSVNDQEFISEKNRIEQNITKLWNSEELSSIFSLNGITYWPLLKNRLQKIYAYRLDDYLRFIFQSRNFFKKLKIKQMICLGESGETENILLQNINDDIESILLQHSFLRYNDEIKNLQWKYEDQKMLDLKSKKFFVWGENDLNYFSHLLSTKKEKFFISGSPRHDNFFETTNSSTDKNIVITLSPISDRSGLGDVNLIIKYNQLLTNLISKLKKITNSKLIIKLHPGENPHNSILLNHLNQIPDITVFQTKNSKDLIINCELLINISPELYDSSTIMLEGLLLHKPVIHLILDEEFFNITPLDSPIIQIHNLSNLDKILERIWLKKEFQQAFIEELPIKLNNYLSYQNFSSTKILELIDND